MELARRAAPRGADADDIYGIPIPAPDGNGNSELVLVFQLCGWNLELVEVSLFSENRGFSPVLLGTSIACIYSLFFR